MTNGDDLLARARELTERLSALPPGSPDVAVLQAERDRLRVEAEAHTLAGRHPDSLRREVKELRRRLRRMDAMEVKKPPFANRPVAMTDPAAYAYDINDRIEEATADERAGIEHRISLLAAELARRGLSED